MNNEELKLVETASPEDLDRFLSQFTAKPIKKARDKNGLEDLASDQLYRVLAARARLQREFQGTFPVSELDLRVTTEAQKVLCNLVFQSVSAQRYFSREDVVDVLFSRISANKESSKWPLENQLLDMKLLFIVTILCAETRSHFRNDLHAVQDLCVTASMLGAEVSRTKKSSATPDEPLVNSIICEILKVLFNLVYNMPSTNLTLGEEMDFVNLGNTSRELLMGQPSDEIKKHIINLLTVVKDHGYNQLAPPLSDDPPIVPVVPFDNFNLYAIDVVLKYLDDKLTRTQSPDGKIRDESLAPVLCALTEASKVVPVIRRYLKLQVLPPLRDVHTRPEVGDTLRNKMCRLLTSPNTSVRDSAGDFLYILCKNNVQRLIKYTGYGNAAGWLAERGLMGLPKSAGDAQMEDTEDSDTEEWIEHRNTINPMTGIKEEKGPDPFFGMTEEQKEYEANQLANTLQRMLKSGAVKPAGIGQDGRPIVMDDLLKFREETLKAKNYEEKHSSDEE